ncbi:MAG: ribbon-helix-helix protein, CopG family [Acidobacteria bacterium]|nr:ribbon-helix-helix protein, CopG family [Acidobacteriota bacterium]
MKRTQLYLDEGLWKVLEIQARQSGTSISELVRQAIRDKYLPSPEERRRAMQAWVGAWKDRTDLPDTETYIRRLRKDNRLRRLSR